MPLRVWTTTTRLVWDRVEPLAANECGGSKNSPTAVDDMACTDYHNYVMVVTSKHSTFEYKRVREKEFEGGRVLTLGGESVWEHIFCDNVRIQIFLFQLYHDKLILTWIITHACILGVEWYRSRCGWYWSSGWCHRSSCWWYRSSVDGIGASVDDDASVDGARAV